jgi:hypothetical protein
MIHLFMFDSTNCSSTGYTSYYSMNNTFLTAENFALRFLGYLRALGPNKDPDKAILRFVYNWGPSSFSPIHDGSPHRPPRSIKSASSAADELGVCPIPLGFFDSKLDPNDPARVRLGEIPQGGWVVLVGRRDPKLRGSEDESFLQYSFVRIRALSVGTAREEVQQQLQELEDDILNSVEVVGGLTDFLRQTAPNTDIPTWETRLEDLESDLSTDSFEPTPSIASSSTDVSVNTWVRRIVEERQLGEVPDVEDKFMEQHRLEQELMDARVGAKEVETKEHCNEVRVMTERQAHTLLDRLR